MKVTTPMECFAGNIIAWMERSAQRTGHPSYVFVSQDTAGSDVKQVGDKEVKSVENMYNISICEEQLFLKKCLFKNYLSKYIYF